MIDSRIRYAIFTLISIGIGLTGSIVLFEVALRLVDWPSPGLYQHGRGPLPLSTASEEGSSWRRYPGVARLRHWDYDVEVHLNADGFIEREPAPKEAGVWRVGLFGDSFTAGMGVPPQQRFGDAWLQQIAGSVPCQMEMYNFGSAWSGTGQSAAFLAEHGHEYDLDEIVLAIFGGNELQDNEYWESYRSLTSAERRLRDEPRRSWRDELRNRSRAAGFVYVSLIRGFARREVLVPTRDFVDEHWAPTARALARFLEAVGDRPLTVWYLPATVEWDDDGWQEMQASRELPQSARHSLRDRVRDWATDHGIPFVDTTEFLRGGSAEEYRFPRDGHWNAAGHWRIAEGLAGTQTASHCQRARRGDHDADSR